ncbi:polyphosphate kinase 1 [Rasiella rasia]|uniref:Polyphosphate kinase n=1 Tax=Rasiella rasia TaxID=2744027 RepID=A0A6G6GNW2_9FLAO|nr:polyphosphate kinase 1 [Rasiella rasia]QIE60239.1 polyphosphate kinase 1 [Rasiella rasia]
MAKLYNSKYYHRDLSWLRFNHRVLQEAADTSNPLYERIKFLAIFSSNLDEFFKVRVSDIRQIKTIEKPLRKKLITKPNKVLKEIKKQVNLQQEQFGHIFTSEIVPELKKHNIHLIGQKDFSATQKEIAKTFYTEHLKDKIEVNRYPNSVENKVFVKNEVLYLTAQLSDNEFAVINIPTEVPRFFTFPKHNGKHYITFIDDILKYCLRQSPKMEQDITFYSIKTSRDAELYIEDELSGNLADKIKNSLDNRNTGQATRMLVDQRMPSQFQDVLKRALDVYNTDIIQGGVYHNFKDFFGFPNPTNKSLSLDALPPLPHPVLSKCNSVLAEIEKKDQLLHYPYQSFEPLIRLLEEAANDAQVTTIKMTIYRAAKESRLNDAIVTAAKNGKKVIVFIEVKARFDEQNNLKWGQIFEDHGAQVIYSFPDIKIHSKILYIEKSSDKGLKRYGYIATGNFNEKTAKLYTDFGLMTAHKKITKDLNKVFLVLEQKVLVPKTKRLLVSPYTTRIGFSELVQNEITLARTGKPASITLKMNSLEDEDMIKYLYRASNAGVKINLLIRGICSLVPGIKGQSENIHVTSVIDRFLEHGRVYIFGQDDDASVYIGSADWMTRNLSHRIEVVTPILDADHKKTIRELIDIQLSDTVKARIIDAQQKNEYVARGANGVQSQVATYNYFKKATV